MQIEDITSINYNKQIKAIFGKNLKRYTKQNNFRYYPSSGYYENNLIRINIGIVFYTPTGKETKLYPYKVITIREKIKSGSCNWVSNINTLDIIKKRILSFITKNKLDGYFKGNRLLKKYKQRIKYFVISTGSGGIPCYKFTIKDIL